MADPQEESPYALAIRLVAQGEAPSTIRNELRSRGLMPDEVVTVLAAVARQQDDKQRAELEEEAALVEIDPSRQSVAELKKHDERIGSMNLMVGLGFVAIGILLFIATEGRLLAYGVTLVGIGRLIAAFLRPRRLPPQVELPDTDTSQRCAEHARFASVGTCPRCGSFRCRDCAPPGGFRKTQVCLSCAGARPYLEERLQATSRRVALALFLPALACGAALAAAVLFPEPMKETAIGLALQRFPLAICAGALIAPFLVVGSLQAAIRHPWPGVVGIVAAALLMILLMELTDGTVELSMAALAVPAIVVAFLLPEHWTRYAEARETPAPPVMPSAPPSSSD